MAIRVAGWNDSLTDTVSLRCSKAPTRKYFRNINKTSRLGRSCAKAWIPPPSNFIETFPDLAVWRVERALCYFVETYTLQDLINTMLDTFMGESGYANDRPGQVTMAVRAYASVMLEHLNSTNTSSTDLGSYQVWP